MTPWSLVSRAITCSATMSDERSRRTVAAAALATAAAADGESSRAHAARRAISGGSIWPNEVTPPTPPPGMHAAGGVAYRKPESIVGVAAPEPCAER